MLPASLHPLSPMPDEAAPPTPHLPSSSSSLSVPPTPFLNSTEGYFSPRLSTILLPPPTLSPSSSPIAPVIPPFLTLKAAPHLLPRDGLDHLPREQLVAIIVALSQANCEAVDEGEKKAREIEALEGMVVQGTGESRRGELERARVRARVDTNGELSVKEWRIELRPEVVEEVEVEVDESEVESNTQTPLNLDDLAEAISDNAYDFPHASATSLLPTADLLTDSEDAASISRISLNSATSHTDSEGLPRGIGLAIPGSAATARQRHTSLSARLFGSFNSTSSSTTVPSGSSPTASPTESSPKMLARAHGRADSIKSVSSVASSIVDHQVESEGVKGGYGEWIGWKSWSGAKGSSVKGKERESEGEGVEDESVVDDLSQTSPRGRRKRGEQTTASSGSTSTSISSILLPHSRIGINTSNTNHAPVTTALSLFPSTHPHSLSFSTTSSPSSSLSPARLATPYKSPRSPSRSPTGSPAPSRAPRTPTLPLITPQLNAVEPSLSTPVPTSTMSNASATITQGEFAAEEETGVDGVDGKAIPTHFEAIRKAASGWLGGSSPPSMTILHRPAAVGSKTGDLVQQLMRNVQAAEESETIRQRAMSEPLLAASPLIAAVPLVVGKKKEQGYVSSAKGVLGRALGLSMGMGMGTTTPPLTNGTTPHGETNPNRRASEPNLTLFPKLSTLSRYSPFAQPALTTPSTQVSLSSHASPSLPHSNPPTAILPTSMELDTISAEAAPPTLVAVSNGSAAALVKGNEGESPLVDRYGFVYDVRSGMKLLREARKRQEKESMGTKDSSEETVVSIDEVPIAGAGGVGIVEVEEEMDALREALGIPVSSHLHVSTSPTPPRSPTPRSLPQVVEENSLAPPLSPSTSAPVSPSPPPPRPLPTSARLVRSQSASSDLSIPPPGGPQSMKRLLGQLTDMHDAVEKTQKEAWDIFIRRRQVALRSYTNEKAAEARPRRGGTTRVHQSGANVGALLGSEERGEEGEWNENLVGVAQMGTAGKSGKSDWSEFKKLVRKGVPIAYRPKIWAECSGANEAREPGLYQELLHVHKGEENACLNQIDMDCHRTFPTNTFFAGNGPGVAKLRNILIAYSWRNPKIGYCQGMNNLAALLLLTHPAEEDAFWVLVCIIEKILPSDYYTSHLLVSQADQRVLRDLVKRHLPDVADHLEDLGVELPAVTFGWFLSLFTDALPIQTLLRIWDLLFVFGTVILFRCAVAIIQMNSVEILVCDSAAGLYALMRNMTMHLYQVDRLLKIACEDLRPIVKERDITILRNRHVKDLRAEMSLPPDSDVES